MKYYLFKLMKVLKKIFLYYYLVFFIIIFIYGFFYQNYDILLKLILGLNVFNNSNIIEFIIRVINFLIIMYSSYEIYFFDFKNSAEFLMLRDTNCHYNIYRVLILLIFNILIPLILSIFIVFFYNDINTFTCYIYGIVNIIYLSLLCVNFYIFLSYKKWIFSILFLILMLMNLLFISKNIIFELISILVLFICNIKIYNPHLICNSFYKK